MPVATDKTTRPAFGTVPEVAEYLRVSRPTVYKLMNDGALQSIRVAGARRIPWEAVTELVESQLQEG